MALRITDKPILGLTEEYSRAPAPPGFVGSLYAHQQTSLKALLDIEEHRTIKLTTNGKKGTLSTSAAVLSEKAGSGKTIVMIALILASPIPKPRAYIHCTAGVGDGGVVSTIAIKYKNLIRATLIIVGSAVITQWSDAFTAFAPHLQVYVVDNYYKLMGLKDMYESGKLVHFDVVILKNGTVTNNFVLPGENQAAIPEHRPLIEAVSTLTQSSVWARVIYDDFDTINIPASVCVVNALFTIYVSATDSCTFPRPRSNVQTLVDALNNSPKLLSNVNDDRNLFKYFNARTNPIYQEASISVPEMRVYEYRYRNPAENVIEMIDAMGGADIVDMLNGDAVKTAADTLGIRADSVADIFEKLLGNEYAKYIKNQKIITHTDALLEQLNNLPHDPPEDGEYTQAAYAAIKKAARKCQKIELSHQTPELHDMLQEIAATAQTKVIDAKRILDRVKESAKLRECMICRLDIEEAVIIKCCSIIICTYCISNLRCGRCSVCKRAITAADLIFIDQGDKVDAFLDMSGDEQVSVKTEDPEPDAMGLNEYERDIKNPKQAAIVSICKGLIPSQRTEGELTVQGLIKGDGFKEYDGPRKVIVFGSHDETLDDLRDVLDKYKITSRQLRGTNFELTATIQWFKNEGDVLLINRRQHCAGVNLEFATDLVVVQSIHEENVAAQVYGRIQRIGRTFSGNIHLIRYNNEY